MSKITKVQPNLFSFFKKPPVVEKVDLEKVEIPTLPIIESNLPTNQIPLNENSSTTVKSISAVAGTCICLLFDLILHI